MSNKPRILSGMQPTGRLHIGHYLGVLNNYVLMQKDYDCYYMVANWHSLTSHYADYKKAHEFIIPLVSDWLAAGIDPSQSVVFVQSMVPQHAELSLILNMYTPISWLMRNPTFKEKKENMNTDLDNAGFLSYPVLQAADILLYDAQKVPIGEDQLPHLEITREIARRFQQFNGEVFTLPEALLSPYKKVLGTDGRKMSKSYHNTINLSDSEDEIDGKLKKMKTDEKRVKRTDAGNPLDCPVFSYYDFFAPQEKEKISNGCQSASIGCIDCKKNIAGFIKEKLTPFREQAVKTQNNPQYIIDILNEGSQKAQIVAQETLHRVKSSMGFASLA